MPEGIIRELIQTYYSATGVAVLCMNTSLKILATSRNPVSSDEMQYLDIEEVINFLSVRFDHNYSELNSFHTYYTKNSIIYNIVLKNLSDKIVYIFIAGPMVIEYPNDQQLELILRRKKLPISKKIYVKTALSKVPLVTFTRIMYLGRFLHTLCESPLADGSIALQKIHGNIKDISKKADTPADIPETSFTMTEENVHVPYELCVEYMETIRKGYFKDINQIVDRMSCAPLDKLINHDLLRSMKNNFIAGIACSSVIALEENLPFEQVMSMADKYIRQVEKLDSMYEIISTMKLAAEAFARSVSNFSYKAHTKPVKQVLHYIQSHFTNKITLNELAEYTHLSPFYLSSLINKETGLSLRDNINQIRIEESKYLLINTTASILEIAQTVGFNYQNHYTANFRKFAYKTPTEFRRNI